MIFIDYERFLQHQALIIIAKQDGYSPFGIVELTFNILVIFQQALS